MVWDSLYDRRGRQMRPGDGRRAARLAERLGFAARSRDDFGTSIMIPGASLDLGEFRKAVEDQMNARRSRSFATIRILAFSEG